MSSALVLAFGEKQHKISAAGAGTDAVRFFKNLEDVSTCARDKLGALPGTYDLYDRYGMIRHQGDLMRALEKAGQGECTIEVREHHHFTRIRGVEAETQVHDHRIAELERRVKENEQKGDDKLEAATEMLKVLIQKVDNRITNEVVPALEGLERHRIELARQTRNIQEKIASLNLAEMREIGEKALALKEDFEAACERMVGLEKDWVSGRSDIEERMKKITQEMAELRRYLSGKLDVCIETDADLRHDEQLLDERLELLKDEVRLLTQDHKRLERQCKGALEESEELRVTLGMVREDNAKNLKEVGQVRTQVHCNIGTDSEKWEQFMQEIQYFRKWHQNAKGCDVQLSQDLQSATGRGFLAATGMVLNNSEGLIVADGPCRRFGTPGQWASYFEVQVNEICAAPESAGGLYVGVSIQSGEEIATHARQEFDGWLVGGMSKALICRRGIADAQGPEKNVLPDTWKQAAGPDASDSAEAGVQLLHAALPPRPRGEVREVKSMWPSQTLSVGDKVGVLFRCNRDGGARMKISVNGDVVATHEFMEAPPADAVGLLTPVVRLAGTGKSARLLPGLSPPSRMLVGL